MGPTPTGIPVDRSGGPTVDPTANVIALSAASNIRQDDLRTAAAEITALHFRLVEKFAGLREEHRSALAAAESRRVDQQLDLRARYEERLARAEANRIDAIRSVDVQAVAVASQRAADQAAVLQAQVTASAEALRALVASTAATFAQNLQQTVGGLSTRLTTLEQGSYQQTGKGEGIGASWAIFLAVAALLIGAFGAIFAFERSTAPTAPQLVYLPVPAAPGAIAAAPKP
jgi:hypothetical protein